MQRSRDVHVARDAHGPDDRPRAREFPWPDEIVPGVVALVFDGAVVRLHQRKDAWRRIARLDVQIRISAVVLSQIVRAPPTWQPRRGAVYLLLAHAQLFQIEL